MDQQQVENNEKVKEYMFDIFTLIREVYRLMPMDIELKIAVLGISRGIVEFSKRMIELNEGER